VAACAEAWEVSTINTAMNRNILNLNYLQAWIVASYGLNPS